MKKIIAFFLCFFMLLSTVPLAAHATDYSGETVNAADLASGDTFQMGMYPQAEVSDSSLIAALNQIECTLQSYGYMYNANADSETSSEVDMRYADIVYGGVAYRKVVINQYRPYCLRSSSNADNSNQDDNGYTIGTYYFKWEPINWKVLAQEDDGVYVIAFNLPDAQPYHNYYKGITWQDSTLRNWLNTTFLNDAFSSAEQSKMISATLSNDDDYTTTDKLWVLSRSELLNGSYGFATSAATADEARKMAGTDYAKCQGIWVDSYSYSDKNSQWLMRTAGDDAYHIKAVDTQGHISGTTYVDNSCMGTRPAFKLNKTATVTPSDSPVCRIAGHSWSAWTRLDGTYHMHECSVCHAQESAAHDRNQTTVVEPTCTQQGYTRRVCSVCGDELIDSYVPALGHNYGEPEWIWAEDYASAKAEFTCSRCDNKQEVGAAVNKSADGKTYTAKATFNGNEYTDVKVKSSATNYYSLTLDDGIKVNFFIDIPFYEAEGGKIKYSYLTTTEDKNAERTKYEVNVTDLEVQSNATRKLTLSAAPAQIAEDYVITVYDASGNKKDTITASIEDYCNALTGSNDERLTPYKDIAQSLLNYGALADEYFGYAVVHNAYAQEHPGEVEGNYAVNHSADYKDSVDTSNESHLRTNAHASITQNGVKIAGVSYVALLAPEFRFYISKADGTPYTETEAAKLVVSIDQEGLSARTVKTTNGICVRVTGLNASEFAKVFTLTVGDTVLTYNGYAYLYTILTNESVTNTKLQDLAKGVYRYASAAEAIFA
ncbi:MAG: hypothetical protein IJJ41_07205 [Clostridia bacterium]|nr:hypothetical protein [Clostridia bacterium]